MQLDPPGRGGEARRRLRGVLVWSGLALLAALALAMVVASLALEVRSEPAPPPTAPLEFSPGAGHASPQ
jgi:hypothetical protein